MAELDSLAFFNPSKSYCWWSESLTWRLWTVQRYADENRRGMWVCKKVWASTPVTLTKIIIWTWRITCFIDFMCPAVEESGGTCVSLPLCIICQYPICRKVKWLFRHWSTCKTQASGGCIICKKMWFLLKLHAQACNEFDCHVPWCRFAHHSSSLFCVIEIFFLFLKMLKILIRRPCCN